MSEGIRPILPEEELTIVQSSDNQDLEKDGGQGVINNQNSGGDNTSGEFSNIHRGDHVTNPINEKVTTFNTDLEGEDENIGNKNKPIETLENDEQDNLKGKQNEFTEEGVLDDAYKTHFFSTDEIINNNFSNFTYDSQDNDPTSQITASQVDVEYNDSALNDNSIIFEDVEKIPTENDLQTKDLNLTKTIDERGPTSGNLTTPSTENPLSVANISPIASDVEGKIGEDDKSFIFNFNAHDVDSDELLTYVIDTQPSLGSVVNNGNETFTYDPNGAFENLAEGKAAIVSFTYHVIDNEGASSELATVQLTVTGANDAPVITSTPVETINEGQNYSYEIKTTDSDNNDVVSVDATLADGTNLPAWLKVQQDNHGNYHLTGDADYQSSGNYDVKVTATDFSGAVDEQTFTLVVNNEKPKSLFSNDDDTIDFNDISEGNYKAGTQYSAGNGNDAVILPEDTEAAFNAGYDPSRKFNAGSGDDVVIGGSLDDHINGGNGNDVLYGHAGDDRLLGGKGDDILYGGSGEDVLLGGSGDDILDGGEGSDQLEGGKGDDVLYAGAGKGDDKLIGGSGNDIFYDGGAGIDVFEGGSGHDTFIFGLESGKNNTVSGGKGKSWTDTIQLESGTIDSNVEVSDWLSVSNKTTYTVDADGKGLTFNKSDQSGTISLSDGSQIDFNQIERVEWE